MYDKNWDAYYRRTYREQGKKALWDVSPQEAAVQDFAQFGELFSPDLPLIDLGCGTGAQTVHLSKHYTKVVGVDVSAEAIAVAREQFPEVSGVTFDCLDVTDIKGAQKLHDKLGDANLYMRGVLHQIKSDDLYKFQAVIKLLLGQSGQLFCVEVSDQIRNYFDSSQEGFSQLPQRMQQVFISNLPPRGLSLDNLLEYFPPADFTLQDNGETKLNTNIRFKSDSPIFIPAIYALVSAKS